MALSSGLFWQSSKSDLATYLVNLTGGGAERAHADGIAIPATPDVVFTKSQDNPDDIRKALGL